MLSVAWMLVPKFWQYWGMFSG